MKIPVGSRHGNQESCKIVTLPVSPLPRFRISFISRHRGVFGQGLSTARLTRLRLVGGVDGWSGSERGAASDRASLLVIRSVSPWGGPGGWASRAVLMGGNDALEVANLLLCVCLLRGHPFERWNLKGAGHTRLPVGLDSGRHDRAPDPPVKVLAIGRDPHGGSNRWGQSSPRACRQASPRGKPTDGSGTTLRRRLPEVRDSLAPEGHRGRVV
jgi:hypothetical protein